ncbi:Hypothetical predicted protein [Prunus dulcis]|uniref:Uncharacterized protein n=1 Tax=Prunus dulcis TaxID=3755 RepID=A0A5E4FT28_PRUDU|nr:hypothetical protein L3X38_024448 [Prunus dulcis]VVA30520.1 Hypothetical predicted protein [Prunus dulcis]
MYAAINATSTTNILPWMSLPSTCTIIVTNICHGHHHQYNPHHLCYHNLFALSLTPPSPPFAPQPPPISPSSLPPPYTTIATAATGSSAFVTITTPTPPQPCRPTTSSPPINITNDGTVTTTAAINAFTDHHFLFYGFEVSKKINVKFCV